MWRKSREGLIPDGEEYMIKRETHGPYCLMSKTGMLNEKKRREKQHNKKDSNIILQASAIAHDGVPLLLESL